METEASTAPSSVDVTARDTNSIHFSSVKQLFKDIDDAPGDALCVRGVSESNFILIDQEREARRRKFRFKRYYISSQLLIITIPSHSHEGLQVGLYLRIWKQIDQMGLERSWVTKSTATFKSSNGDRSEGDATGAPRPQRSGKQGWPTLVIEAGYSETMAQLRQDMRWWFSASNHQVKIVLLVKMHVSSHQIIIERWQEVPALPRQGATTTRSAGRLVPSCMQTITIDRVGSNALDPLSYAVTRGALRLGFFELFLRAPGPGEHDVVIQVQHLQEFAADVWEES